MVLGLDVDTGVGILRKKDGAMSEVEVYELKSGKVERTKILKREGGKIVEQSADQKSRTAIATYAIASVQSNCDTCMDVCGFVYTIGCGVTGYLACNLACLSIAGPLCPLICAAVYAAVCWWAIGWGCDTICGSPEGLGYC